MRMQVRSWNKWNECEKILESKLMIFYKLEFGYEESCIEGSESNDWEGIVCTADPRHQRAGRRVTTLHLGITGSKLTDFSRTLLDFVITDHALTVLKTAGLTGFTVKPTVIDSYPKGFDPQSIPKLWELQVTGWGGMAPVESGMQLIKSCSACGSLKYSGTEHVEQILDETQWDGSDFFFVWPLPKYIFVTERAAKIIHDKQLTGVRLLNSSELGQVEGASPGRLHYYLPEAHAHELGDPLGIY